MSFTQIDSESSYESYRQLVDKVLSQERVLEKIINDETITDEELRKATVAQSRAIEEIRSNLDLNPKQEFNEPDVPERDKKKFGLELINALKMLVGATKRESLTDVLDTLDDIHEAVLAGSTASLISTASIPDILDELIEIAHKLQSMQDDPKVETILAKMDAINDSLAAYQPPVGSGETPVAPEVAEKVEAPPSSEATPPPPPPLPSKPTSEVSGKILPVSVLPEEVKELHKKAGMSIFSKEDVAKAQTMFGKDFFSKPVPEQEGLIVAERSKEEYSKANRDADKSKQKFWTKMGKWVTGLRKAKAGYGSTSSSTPSAVDIQTGLAKLKKSEPKPKQERELSEFEKKILERREASNEGEGDAVEGEGVELPKLINTAAATKSLHVLLGSWGAGNKSKKLKKAIMDLADLLKKRKALQPAKYKKIVELVS